MKRHTKYNPQKGERYAKLDSQGRVVSRTVTGRLGKVIVYTPRRVIRWTSEAEWRDWVKDAHLCK